MAIAPFKEMPFERKALASRLNDFPDGAPIENSAHLGEAGRWERKTSATRITGKATAAIDPPIQPTRRTRLPAATLVPLVSPSKDCRSRPRLVRMRDGVTGG